MIVKMFSALPGAVGAFPEAAAAFPPQRQNCKTIAKFDFAILRRPVEKSLKGLLGKLLYRPSCVAFCNIIYGIAIPAMDAMDQSRICRKRSPAKVRRTHRIKEIMFGDFHDQRSKVQPAHKECNGTRILWEHPEGCLLRVLRERKQADSFFPTVCVKFINTRCIKPAI